MTTPTAPDDKPLAELRSAMERHLSDNKALLKSIYGIRGLLLAAILVTLLAPVLENKSGLMLNGNGTAQLSGWDTIYIASQGVINGVQAKVWAINPFALAAYGLASYFAYAMFVSRKVRPDILLIGSGVMFAAQATTALTHLLAASWFLTGYNADWKAQGLCWGWWLSTAAALGYWLSTWASQLNLWTDETATTPPAPHSSN